jgi:hypothetical protein
MTLPIDEQRAIIREHIGPLKLDWRHVWGIMSIVPHGERPVSMERDAEYEDVLKGRTIASTHAANCDICAPIVVALHEAYPGQLGDGLPE